MGSPNEIHMDSTSPPPSPPPQYEATIPPQPRMPQPRPSAQPLNPYPGPSPGLTRDPRSSSTQSLLPTESYSSSDSRRTLLVIYIHGFLGNDQSFRSFPAHVHAVLSAMLADSHVIHSKIYPRYKTYRAIDVARDRFSEWLEPHESPTTDVVLVGHSMGGLLAADVVLMPNQSPYGQYPLKHRIIGHVSLDCPFLGLHPGIIVSGISSLFKPAPAPPGDHAPEMNHEIPDPTSPGSSSLNLTTSQSSYPGSPSSVSSMTSPTDPFYNPPFWNDTSFREQPFVKRMFHFASKYKSEGLVRAAANHVMSYLEFGGCLADPRGLQVRYTTLRALEDVDEIQRSGPGRNLRGPDARVRFVNYYTLCTGRPKPPKTPSPKTEETDASSTTKKSFDAQSQLDETHSLSLRPSNQSRIEMDDKDSLSTGPESTRPSIEFYDAMDEPANKAPGPAKGKGKGVHNDKDSETESLNSDRNRHSLQWVDPTPMGDMDNIAPEPLPDYKHEADASSGKQSKQPKAPSTGSSSNLPEHQTDPESQPITQTQTEPDLPPIPPTPAKPTLPDMSQYTDKDSRKQAERESKRLQKAYDQAVKDRTKALRERDKLVEKRRKKAQKDAEKLEKDALKEADRLEKEAAKERLRVEKEASQENGEMQRLAKEADRMAQEAARMEAEARRMRGEPPEPTTAAHGVPPSEEQHGHLPQEQGHMSREQTHISQEPPSRPSVDRTPSHAPADIVAEAQALEAEKPKKLRRFCNLPDKINGARDPAWVDVFMTDVDEVGAHCGLFFPGPHYEGLVGDVGSRIVGWMQEDMTKRAILDMGA
ncbi:hypothetical protein G7046_g6741 [Stylonectria norvegica]|nr:hypothetical protein G7046_g6741 [Stylonectria norvegica]